MTSRDLGPLDRLADRASSLAGAWAARARASTTVGRERALLRLLGVGGLDAAGRPLAWSVVDRFLAGGRDRLGGGVVLPFAMALVEYDLDPQRLALDVASGAVDLGMEAELLREADRRALAEEEARRLAAAALERIDANRTARRELLDVLGDPVRPWIGTTIGEIEIEPALAEMRAAVAAGADLVAVDIPIGRELTDRLRDAGLDAPVWRPRTDLAVSASHDIAPTGSQRALAALRRELDEVAAERRGYIRIASAPPALGAPESAVVAAFERVDLVTCDPLAEIVAGRVAPDRALADQAFAHGLLARAGVVVGLGPGPLVVAPDLSAGVPSDPATRAGRALALQLLAVAVARGNGVPAEQLAVGAIPAWTVDEPEPAGRAAAEIAVRRALFPDLGLVLEEPPPGPDGPSELWPAVIAAVVVPSATLAILRRGGATREDSLRGARTAAIVATELEASGEERRLTGSALEHARATTAAALMTLDRLAEGGWRSIIDDGTAAGERRTIGADAVAERTEAFDPFAVSPAGVSQA